jgi:hypothetical protein
VKGREGKGREWDGSEEKVHYTNTYSSPIYIPLQLTCGMPRFLGSIVNGLLWLPLSNLLTSYLYINHRVNDSDSDSDSGSSLPLPIDSCNPAHRVEKNQMQVIIVAHCTGAGEIGRTRCG